MLPCLLRLSGAPTVNLSRFSWSGGATVNLSRFSWSGGATVILSRFPWSGGLAANLSIFPWSAIPDGCFKVFSRRALARVLRALTGRFPSRRGLGLMLGLLRPSGAYLGHPWADHLKPPAASLGRSWGAPGPHFRLLAAPGAVLRFLGPCLGPTWGSPGVPFGAFWGSWRLPRPPQ